MTERRRIIIEYSSETSGSAERTLRPLGLYFWGKVWTLAAWCELRDDFRNFRIDRIANARRGEPFKDEPDKTLEVFLARARERAETERGNARPPTI